MIVLRNVSCNARYWKNPVDVEVGQYDNGRLAISLLEHKTGEPVGTVTTNLVDEQCPDGEVWVKEWSEGEGMTKFLIDAGIILPCATDVTTTGYVNVMRYALTPKFIEACARALTEEKAK